MFLLICQNLLATQFSVCKLSIMVIGFSPKMKSLYIMGPNSMVDGEPYLLNLNAIQCERDMTDMVLIITNPVRPKIESF